jgi:hypothetical protein
MPSARPARSGLDVTVFLFVGVGALIGLRALFRTVHDISLLIFFAPLVLFPYLLVLFMTRYCTRQVERRLLIALAVALLLSALPLLSTNYHDMQAIIVILIPFGQSAVTTVVGILLWVVHRASR